MAGECCFFDIETYSSDFENWSEWDWPGKVWQRISDLQLSVLFEDEHAAVRAFGEEFSAEEASADTPSELVTDTALAARDVVETWIETVDDIPETCPFEADTEGDRCRFHSPPDSESEQDGWVREQILSGDVTSLVGANLSDLDLCHANLDIDTDRTLRLDFCSIDSLRLRRARLEKNIEIRYATIGTFEFDHAHFSADLDLSYSEVWEDLSGSHAVFEGQLYGIGARVVTGDAIELDEGIFHRYVCFDDAYFEGKLNMWNGVFHADSEFRSAIFDGGINARWIDFNRFPDFHQATFRDDADFGGATFYDDAGFSQGTFESDLHFQTDYNSFEEYAAVFHGVVDFTGSTVEGDLNMRETEFKKYASFQFLEVEGSLSLWNAEFDEDADFREGVFGGDVDLRWSIFRGYGDFNETEFRGTANFGGVKFVDDIGFSEAVFRDSVSFRGEFSGYDEYKGECHGIADFGNARFESTLELRMIFRDDVSFVEVDFLGDVDITATFEQSVDVREAKFHERADFSGSSFHDEATFDRVRSKQLIDMSGVEFARGVISQPEDGVTYYDFTRSVVGAVDFKPLSDENLFSYVRFCETEFDGFDFPHHGAVLMGNWRLHEFEPDYEEPDTNQLINTYLKAKNGANDVGSQAASSEFFMQEMRFRRKAHWNGVLNSPPLQRITSFGNWLSNWFLNLSCGYGERPLRTITASVFLVGFFSMLYWAVGLAEQASPLTYLLFSTQAFVTLIFGKTPAVESTMIQFLAAIQGFLGAFFIALFVFALTRSINR
jgi:uncharacterized protein YjbI with pentapeptide repeats